MLVQYMCAAGKVNPFNFNDSERRYIMDTVNVPHFEGYEAYFGGEEPYSYVAYDYGDGSYYLDVSNYAGACLRYRKIKSEPETMTLVCAYNGQGRHLEEGEIGESANGDLVKYHILKSDWLFQKIWREVKV